MLDIRLVMILIYSKLVKCMDTEEKRKHCPLCLLPIAHYKQVKQLDYGCFYWEVDCTDCGKFQIEERFDRFPEFDDVERVKLRFIIRNYLDEHAGPFKEIFKIENNHKSIIAAASIPKGVDDRINLILRYIASTTSNLGDYTPPSTYAIWCNRLFLANQDMFIKLHNALSQDKNWIKVESNNPQGKTKITLTLSGWEEVRKLHSRSGTGKQAFVAMWFHDDMDDLYSQAIKPALESAGYTPFCIKWQAHTQRIDDKIISEIRKSRILIADVTGQRQSVYYEAGFAHGLNIPVIWTCDGREESNLHFDTRQYHHILWKNYKDLRERLIERIEALGLDLSPSSHS